MYELMKLLFILMLCRGNVMKKLVLAFLLSTQCVVLAYSVRDLEKSIMASDLEKTRALIKKIEVTREERFRLLERAQEMIGYRRKRPFCRKSFKEVVAQAGMIGLPVMGSGILLGLDIVLNKRLAMINDVINLKINLFEGLNYRDVEISDGNSLQKEIQHHFNFYVYSCWLYSNYLNKILDNKKSLLIVGGSAIIAGPVLWLLKRYFAKKSLAEQERLYLNAVEIKQLMYTVAIKNVEVE